MSTTPGQAALAPVPDRKGGCEPFWDAEELKPLLRGLGWAQRVLQGRQLVARSS